MDPVTLGIIAGGGILGGGVLSFLGGQSQAEAQQRAAEAQAAALREQSRLAYDAMMAGISERRAERGMALEFAAPSAADLEVRSNLLDLQRQVLGRANSELQFLQRGLDIAAPGSAEAGRGLFSSIIARQRASQRQQLESTLRDRFGAGFASTSAGQMALNEFDQATADVGVQAIPMFLQQAYQSVGATASFEDQVKRRQIAAAQGTAVSPMFGELAGLRAQFAGPLAQSAQAPFVGQAARGQALAGLGGTFSNIGGMALGKGLGGMFGTKTDTGGGGGLNFLNYQEPTNFNNFSNIA